MVSKGNFIQVGVIVIGIERSEAAIFRLHTANPFGCPLHRPVIGALAASIHLISHCRGVVQIRVMSVYELKRPSTSSDMPAVVRPILGLVQQLFCAYPTQGFFYAFL